MVFRKKFRRNHDKIKRYQFSQNWNEKMYAKAFFFDSFLAQSLRKKAFISLSRYIKNSSIVRLRNRCILSVRGNGVKRKFYVSRIAFKECLSKGNIPAYYR